MTSRSTPADDLGATRRCVRHAPTGMAVGTNLDPLVPATAAVVSHRHDGGEREGDGDHA
jgi:hypothetical protein